jgi:hypothetical protein
MREPVKAPNSAVDPRQEILDTFYHCRGPCCAGCDWWHSISSTIGECHQSAMVSGHDRMLAMGIDWSSLEFGAGHVITRREHVCGEFKDEFDWSTLPLPYRKRIGAPMIAGRTALNPPAREGEGDQP